ncbi:hypothetical protein [Desulfosediminicola sp.]|uniref:hypothetical protein n=1 Tax=Desulfosediminicola sp. TaxID=2886825 RepID=UPI003AF2ECAC
MAHDLNNIISAIIDYTDLSLTSENLPQNNKSNLLQLQKVSRSACYFINNIGLISSRGIAARCMCMDPLISASLETIQKNFPPNIDMVISAPERLDKVNIEPTLLDLLLVQLCKNAVQAIENSNGVLHVKYERKTAGSEPALKVIGS